MSPEAKRFYFEMMNEAVADVVQSADATRSVKDAMAKDPDFNFVEKAAEQSENFRAISTTLLNAMAGADDLRESLYRALLVAATVGFKFSKIVDRSPGHSPAGNA